MIGLKDCWFIKYHCCSSESHFLPCFHLTAKRDPLTAQLETLRVFDGEMKVYVRTQGSLSVRRGGVIFPHICHFMLFPIYLQACPFVTWWMWVMHHTGHWQTLPSGPLVHRSVLREPWINLDSLTCVCMCVLYAYMWGSIYLCIRGNEYVCVVAECTAPVCICAFVFLIVELPQQQ